MANLRDKVLRLVGKKIKVGTMGEGAYYISPLAKEAFCYSRILHVGDDYFDVELVGLGPPVKVTTFSISSITTIHGVAEDYESI